MIVVVTGKIGSGKTYWAVNYLVEKYYTWKDEILCFVPHTDIKIISNIDGLSLPHADLKSEIKSLGMDGVFSSDYTQSTKSTCVFIIDESQGFFGRKYYNEKVFLFFQMSRHYGADIVLITQDVSTLCKELQVLSEYEVHSQQRSLRTKNILYYKYHVSGERIRTKSLKLSPRIYRLYKTQEQSEVNAPGSVIWKWGLMAVGLVLAGLVLSRLVYGIFTGGRSAHVSNFKSAQKTELQQSSNNNGKPSLPSSSSASVNSQVDQLNKSVDSSGKLVIDRFPSLPSSVSNKSRDDSHSYSEVVEGDRTVIYIDGSPVGWVKGL